MRYIVLVLLNLPIILLALLNIITQYKMNRVSRRRLYQQLLLWLIVLLVLICSFPVYNIITHRPLFDSTDLSGFDIAEITTIIYLVYVINNLNHKLDQTDRRLRDLHQELSIKLSNNR